MPWPFRLNAFSLRGGTKGHALSEVHSVGGPPYRCRPVRLDKQWILQRWCRVPSLAAISDATSNAAARAFVRSLNILLKYSRPYGPEHQRTQSQSAVAWKVLSRAHPAAGRHRLLVGLTGTQLLLEGIS